MNRGAIVLVAAALATTSPVASAVRAQSLASRIDAVRDGSVDLAFAARPGVCGDGHGSTWTMGHRDDRANGWRPACIEGPVRVTIARSEGQIASVRSCVACPLRSSGGVDVDLGTVPPANAARYLVRIARTLGGSSASEAVAAAAVADGVDLAPELTRLVRDEDATTAARKDALFWLGQSEDVRSRDLAALYGTLKPQPLREHFTFVLSQRHDDDVALDALIDIARRDADMQVRKQAMFWLGQSHDPKAIKFFQTILAR